MEDVMPASNNSPKIDSFFVKIKSFLINNKKFWIPAALVVIGITVILLSIFLPEKIHPSVLSEKWDKLTLDQEYVPEYSISPSEDRKYGIIPQESFILKTKNPQTESFVQENLISDKPVIITKISDTEYKISLANPLGVGETISMTIKGDGSYSWIFETAPRFKIVTSLPGNESKNVPVNTGIEITFNNDSYNLTANNIGLEPKFDFRIEKHDQVAAIIPLKPLEPETVYKVTVKKDFGLLSGGNTLSEDYNFSFQTGDTDVNRGRPTLARNFQEVFPDEPLVTKVYTSNWDVNQNINAQVYKFPSVESFISSRVNVDKAEASWVSYYGEKDMVDTKNLSRVLAVDVKIQEKDKVQFIQLPQNLDEGLYLVQFWFDGYKKVEQLWVQSGTVVGYTSVGRLQTAVWLNSSKNESIDSSTIQVLGTGDTYSANGQGWAVFPTPEIFMGKVRHYILATTSVGSRLILPINNLSNRAKPQDMVADDYWSYLYHERVLYKSNDTVYFWGVVKNRDSGAAPSQVDLYLGDTLKGSTTPSSDGSFVGKIDLVNEPAGYESLSAKISGVTVASSYLQISDYVKPELKIEVEGNKKAIFAGEPVEYKARVTFFDGTPASNVHLYLSANYSGNGTVDKSEATADTNGYITFKYQSKADSINNYPRYEGVTVSAIKSGQGPSDGSASVYVYGSKLQFETQSSQNKDQAVMKIKVNTLDLNLVNLEGKDSPISGTAANQKVHVTNTRTWWEPVQTGTYYDYVEKITKPSFDYKRHDDVVDSKDLYTNGQGEITYNFQMELNRSYTVKVATTDDQNRPAEANSYFYYSDYQGDANQMASTNLNIDRDTNYFSIGDEVNINLQKNGSLYKKTDTSKFLFVVAERGRQEVYVTDVPELKLTFQAKYVPNVYVGSIIFNGKFYEEVRSECKSGWSCAWYDQYGNDYYFDPTMLAYRKDDSKLDLNIRQDQIKYQPGGTANITVQVSKKGVAISGATVQLTLVDEALASIGGVNKPSILNDLYKWVGDYIYYNYYSHRPLFPDGPVAERGGGGGGRDLFKDTAFFGTAQTDVNGEAKFSIKLPDNITNWLTYAQALTPDIDAGQTESSVVATKNYFVTSQFPALVTLKDSPYVAVNSFGNALSGNEKIPVSASFYKDDQVVAKEDATTTAFKEAYFAFPKLTSGGYKVTVSGKNQDYQDAVTLPLTVVDSRLNFNLVKNKILSKGDILKSFEGVNPAPGKPVKLLVTDEGKGKYFYNLLRYCYQNSNRLEKRIASVEANKIIIDRFKDDSCTFFNGDIANFQNSDGGLKQVIWGNSDLETSVWSIYVDASLFNKEQLIKYFENSDFSYSGTATEKSILKNWGLTMLGKSDINELNRLANSASTFKEKVLAALALNAAGNTERSKQMYYQILESYAYTNKPYLRIQSETNKNDYGNFALDTSYVLLLGTLNNSPYNQGFDLYLRDYSSYAENVVLDLADISYLNTVLARLPDKNTTVTFKSDLRTLTKDITKDGALAINLKNSEVNKFNLSVGSGVADASISYFSTPDDFQKMQADSRLSLKKTVAKVKGAPGGIKIGDILQVTLHYDFDSKAPEGCYVLIDHIPSGMTFLDSPDNYDLNVGRKGSLYPENQNVVKGCAYNSYWWRFYTGNDSIYFERVTGVGKFVQEPAIIQAGVDPSIFQKTSEEYVNVEQ